MNAIQFCAIALLMLLILAVQAANHTSIKDTLCALIELCTILADEIDDDETDDD